MLLIGNHGNRRTEALQAARRKLGLAPAALASYEELLSGKLSLTELAERGVSPSLLRLDSPGELFTVERGLIALGAPDAVADPEADRLLWSGSTREGGSVAQPLSAAAAAQLEEQRGQIVHPSQWFRGFARLLARLEQEAAALWPHADWVHPPAAVVAMFDKRRSHELLAAGGTLVPPRLAPPDALISYEGVRETMIHARMHRIFLKLACGSGASGVLAYQVNPVSGAEIVMTTLAVENYVTRPPIYYNSSKLRRYTEPRLIRQLINWLLRHGAHAEQWIAKAAAGDGVYDIRQLVVEGRACHSIARVSRTPITNLHLRNQRMSLDELELAEAARLEVARCAERALSLYPGVRSAGIDVLVSRSEKVYVLEVNPFGDLLYRVFHQGADPYEWQLLCYRDQLAARGESGACPT
ncbi:STM4014 family protein [Paenibacillus sp. 1P07SE]|uniref:STM4014 family protein n=1 Tax=Paenibacillus sp. 1P07SE TaxID=3132209 RepID=UPI0039A756FC